MYAEQLLAPWLTVLRNRLPLLDIVDMHVHVGLADPAGLLATEEEALTALHRAGAHGVVFPLKEPGGYRDPNDRVLELARRSNGRVTALARLDPADDPLGEAVRCLDAGAAGIKLHPRGEGFALDDRRLDDVFALADERRLPIMIHAGQGVPEMADQARRRSREHPGARLILAHCGAGVFDGIWPRIDDYPNLLFDTSWWNPATIAALLRLVPPSRILFASDVPFATPTQQAVQTLRLALQVGLTDRQIEGIMGGQARRVLAHQDLLDLGPTPPDEQAVQPALERMYVMLVAASERMLGGQEGGQELQLALDGCAAGADGPNGDVLRAVGGLLGQIEGLTDRDPLRQERTPGFDLAVVAATIARTPDAPLVGPEPRAADATAGQGDAAVVSSSASTGGRPDPGQRTTATEAPSTS
jgi:predicted TIM-barrel fold metal-dependent hydrolase